MVRDHNTSGINLEEDTIMKVSKKLTARVQVEAFVKALRQLGVEVEEGGEVRVPWETIEDPRTILDHENVLPGPDGKPIYVKQGKDVIDVFGGRKEGEIAVLPFEYKIRTGRLHCGAEGIGIKQIEKGIITLGDDVLLGPMKDKISEAKGRAYAEEIGKQIKAIADAEGIEITAITITEVEPEIDDAIVVTIEYEKVGHS